MKTVDDYLNDAAAKLTDAQTQVAKQLGTVPATSSTVSVSDPATIQLALLMATVDVLTQVSVPPIIMQVPASALETVPIARPVTRPGT